MKRIILTTWLSAAAVACLAQASTQETGLATSPTNVAEQSVNLRKLIIPPKGTSISDVQTVFGKPTRIPGTGKGESPTEHPVHLYELLMPKDDTRGCALMYGADSYRAILSLDYVDGRVAKATIIHQCVAASRPIYMPGSKEDEEQKNTIAQEQRSALADLLAIAKKYEDKLKDASWNKDESEPKPDGDGLKPAP